MIKGKKNLIKLSAVILIGAMVAGCTIRPTAFPAANIISQLNRSPGQVLLIMDEKLRNFQSRDRGHALADPVVVKLGQSLASLANSYFDAGFTNVKTAASMPATSEIPAGTYAVKLMILNFDSRVSSLLKQEIEIELGADVYNSELRNIKSLKTTGFAGGRLPPLGDSSKQATHISKAIQNALIQLVDELQETI